MDLLPIVSTFVFLAFFMSRRRCNAISDNYWFNL